MVLNNKTFRIFVSSTFADLKEERNALQKHVFPKLRELCMEHGFRFQAIDLRWGVSEEAGLDQQTMKICLEEIERSQRVSPKPNFIVLLGDRYGWRPLPYEIPADEFEEIKKVVSTSDKDFLFWECDVLEDDQLKKREGWYCRDENAVPPVYCLKPRLVGYDENASDDEIKEARDLEYKDWEDVEKRLKSILLNAIDELGWDKNDSRRFKYESSATEQEIIKGVLKLPEDGSLSEEHVFSFIRKIKGKKGIPFDDYSKDFFDFDENKELDDSAEEKLIALKDKIEKKLSKSNRFDYETEWEEKGVSRKHIKKLCEDVYYSLEKVIKEQIDEFEEQDPLDIEIGAHREFGKDRCKFFIGREDNRAQIKNYLDNPNSKPLIVYGDSGSGKSALMAQVMEDSHPSFYKTPVDNIIVRFIGATPESSDMRSLLESLSRQITRIYDEDDSNIPTEYNDLVQDFKERLNFPNIEKPLFIFLDALDQLSDSENAHNLSWIPNELPKNVNIVISTLKNIFQSSLEHNYSENSVEVLPLEKNDGKNILEAWFSDNKRKLTDEQENELVSKFEVEGLPLYLKLAFEESKIWKSYTPIPKFQSDIKWMINNLFERLSRPENHGEMLVSRSLGYLSAAKNGLTEDEMLDILALDDDVFNLTTKFHEPTENKLPVALWSRLYFDLEPYLTERSADETTLLAFYHRQLCEVAKEKYLDNKVKKSRHQLIAEYFYKQELYSEQDEKRVYNVRKVSELPYQEIYGECWKPLEDTLCDLMFVEAKCAVGMTYHLIRDYNLALDMHPDAQKEKQNRLEHEERVDKYVKDLIDYSKGKISYLDIIPSVKPWTEEEIKKNIERSINNHYPLDQIKAFASFVNSESHALKRFGYLPTFPIQTAYNSVKSGPVGENARKIIKKIETPLILKDEKWIPPYNPHPALLKTIEGHNEIIRGVAITPNGKFAVTGGGSLTERVMDPITKEQIVVMYPPTGSVEINAKVWDLETGELIKTLKGHTSSVSTIAVTPDSRLIVTGSLDRTIGVWDLNTGKLLKTMNNQKDYVRSIDVTPDGKFAVTGSFEKIVRVWNLEIGKCLKTLKGHTETVKSVAVTPDGKIAITGSDDKTVRVWNLKLGKQIKIFDNHIKNVTAVAVTPDGKIGASASLDKNIFIWDLKTGNLLKKLESTSPINAMAITPDSRIMVTGNTDRVGVWDLEVGKLIKNMHSHADLVKSVAVTPDGKILISGSNDKTVRVWNLESIKQSEIEDLTQMALAFDVTPDGKIVVIGAINVLYLLDVETGEKIKKLEGHSEMIRSVAISPDNKFLISGSNDKTVRVWNLKSGKQVKKLNDQLDTIFCVAISCDGRIGVTGSNDHTVRIWDLETGNQLKIIEIKGDVAESIAISQDNRFAVIGTSEGYVVIFDLKLEEIKRMNGHVDRIRTIDISPNGRFVISGSYDCTVRVWDLETGNQLKIIESPGSVFQMAVSPDGNYVITRTNRGTICVYDLMSGNLILVNKEDYLINYLAIKKCSLFLGTNTGHIFSSNILNLIDLPITTAIRIWLYDKKNGIGIWDNNISALCPFCGIRFNVSNEILNSIGEIKKQYENSYGYFAADAGKDPRLISECPECHQKIKFNPFIVDNKEKKKPCWKFWK